MKKIVKSLAVAALLAAATAAGAQATVYEKFNWGDTWSYSENCGFEVDVTGSGGGVFVLREGKNKKDGVFPFLDNFRYEEKWTNAETGDWFVIRGHVVFNEVKATQVDDTVFLFSFVEAGQPVVVEDSSGKVVERNRGSVRGDFLFDNGGDDQPGGTYLEFFEVKIAGPHPGYEKHPCDYAAELIG